MRPIVMASRSPEQTRPSKARMMAMRSAEAAEKNLCPAEQVAAAPSLAAALPNELLDKIALEVGLGQGEFIIRREDSNTKWGFSHKLVTTEDGTKAPMIHSVKKGTPAYAAGLPCCVVVAVSGGDGPWCPAAALKEQARGNVLRLRTQPPPERVVCRCGRKLSWRFGGDAGGLDGWSIGWDNTRQRWGPVKVHKSYVLCSMRDGGCNLSHTFEATLEYPDSTLRNKPPRSGNFACGGFDEHVDNHWCLSDAEWTATMASWEALRAASREYGFEF